MVSFDQSKENLRITKEKQFFFSEKLYRWFTWDFAVFNMASLFQIAEHDNILNFIVLDENREA